MYKHKHLYVAGEGDAFVYCTAENIEVAKITLGAECRTPTPDDIAHVWRLGKLDQLSGKEIRERLGISRQALDYWWRKAGSTLPRRSQHVKEDRTQRILDLVKKTKGRIPVTQIARKIGTTPDKVRDVVKLTRYSLPTCRKRPSDEKLVRMARGRTWRELATAVGMQLTTLRAYVYSKPELAKKIRAVRKPQKSGTPSHKLTSNTVKRLAYKGLSAYAISVRLGVEPKSVHYWLKKLALQESHAPTDSDNRRETEAVVAGCTGRPERD